MLLIACQKETVKEKRLNVVFLALQYIWRQERRFAEDVFVVVWHREGCSVTCRVHGAQVNTGRSQPSEAQASFQLLYPTI